MGGGIFAVLCVIYNRKSYAAFFWIHRDGTSLEWPKQIHIVGMVAHQPVWHCQKRRWQHFRLLLKLLMFQQWEPPLHLVLLFLILQLLLIDGCIYAGVMSVWLLLVPLLLFDSLPSVEWYEVRSCGTYSPMNIERPVNW